MEYLTSYKFPLRSMLTDDAISNDSLFIEHIAEQAIMVARAGGIVTDETYDMLDKAGMEMIHMASRGKITEEQTRVFDKIWSAVQLNSAHRDAASKLDARAHKLISGSVK